MDLNLQRDVVTHLLHHPNANIFFGDLPSDAFDSIELSIAIQLIQAYLSRYGKVPPNKEALRAFTVEQDGGKESIEQLEACIDRLYSPNLITSEDLANGKAIELIKQKQLLDLLRDSAPKLLNAEGEPLDMEKFLKKTKRILDFSPLGGESPMFSVKEDIALSSRPKVFRTHLQGLNNLTNAGGFHRPQLIVFMAAPKGFKTGTLISLGMGMALIGARIVYFDYENGGESIHTRAMKAMLNCTEAELFNASEVQLGGNRTLEQLKYEMRKDLIRLNADFTAFEMRQKTSVSEAEVKLLQYKEETGYSPDGLIFDYADLMSPKDVIENKTRFSIQGVYKDIVDLNKSEGTFAFTQSQVRREAISKEVIELDDFSEDIGKAHNAHAAFALCRTKEELAAGLGRLVPVMQREGDRFNDNAVLLEINEDRQEVTEIHLKKDDSDLDFGDN